MYDLRRVERGTYLLAGVNIYLLMITDLFLIFTIGSQNFNPVPPTLHLNMRGYSAFEPLARYILFHAVLLKKM